MIHAVAPSAQHGRITTCRALSCKTPALPLLKPSMITRSSAHFQPILQLFVKQMMSCNTPYITPEKSATKLAAPSTTPVGTMTTCEMIITTYRRSLIVRLTTSANMFLTSKDRPHLNITRCQGKTRRVRHPCQSYI